MQVLGSSKVILNTKSRSIKTEALVTTNLANPVLLSWHDLIRLRVIDEHFPQTVNSVTMSTCLQILEKYPNVFKDTLDQNPMITEKVHLYLKPNAVPHRVSAARKIPLRFREPAEACIKELLTKQVITPCHTPTEWCSPAFFFVKPDGKNVQMVTDFTRLNSFVKRPVHPFACVSEILQTIPASAKFFAKMDAVNGYF